MPLRVPAGSQAGGRDHRYSAGQPMLVLGELIVNTGLRHIRQALRFPGTGLERVVTTYAGPFGRCTDLHACQLTYLPGLRGPCR
jgi:hypothetical protein